MEQFSDDEVDELRSRFQSLWFFLPLFPLPFSRVVLGALARAGGGFPVINSYEFVYSIRGYSSHFFFLSPCHAFLALFDEQKQTCHEYFKRDFLRRLFQLLDTASNNTLTFENYLEVAYLFLRCGDYEQRQCASFKNFSFLTSFSALFFLSLFSVLFSLYDTSASHQLSEDNLKLMFKDANVLVSVEDSMTVEEVEQRLQAANEAIDNMVRVR